MTAEAWIALGTVPISLAALFFSMWAFKGQLRASTRPVLVFTRTGNVYWRIDNVGSGPAIEVRVIGADREGWKQQVLCAPIAAGEALHTRWLRFGWELGCTYTDTYGNTYNTLCRGYRNIIGTGSINPPEGLPKAQLQWEAEQILDSQFSEADLEGKSTWELDVMRNEFFARHGYVFKRTDLAAHFNAQSWYVPRLRDVKKVVELMSSTERATVAFIKAYQDRSAKGEAAVENQP
jgi:hypothetical protein